VRTPAVADQVQVEERQSLRGGPERQRRGVMEKDDHDFIGGIRIS
jgi:hypothetical protein